MIPATSNTRYITGSAALNIPDETGDAADWHFFEHFLGDKGEDSIPVSGETFMSTEDLLGNYGIHECSDFLKRQGIQEVHEPVYAANAVRAVLDLVLRHICERGGIPEHIDPGEYLNSPDQLNALRDAAKRACKGLPVHQREALCKWIQIHDA